MLLKVVDSDFRSSPNLTPTETSKIGRLRQQLSLNLATSTLIASLLKGPTSLTPTPRTIEDTATLTPVSQNLSTPTPTPTLNLDSVI